MSINSYLTVMDVLRRLRFSPSCVDMGWKWEVVAASGEADGFMLRTTFQRPDRDTGMAKWGFGRWWHVPSPTTEGAIVKTAYAAAKMILEHELAESFRFDGLRIFDPHHSIDDLRKAVEHHDAVTPGLEGTGESK